MTFTSSSFVPLLIVATLSLIISAGWTVWRRRIPGTSLGTSIRTAVYLTRYATALEYYGFRRGEITAHVETIRGELAAVEPSQVDTTLGRYGAPRTLAADVAGDTMRPSILRGSVWFGAAVISVLAWSILMTELFLAGFESVAEPTETASWSGLGFSVSAIMGANGQAQSVEFGGVIWLVVPLIAFVSGARVWRFRRRTSRV